VVGLKEQNGTEPPLMTGVAGAARKLVVTGAEVAAQPLALAGAVSS